jgi:hypothetical protein
MSAHHTWSFFRAGGFDQVRITSGADLLALKDLDQKLWVALSCPTRGVHFDTKTLDLIDGDGDARVRANEVLAAIAWAGSLLKNPDVLLKETDLLSLSDIDDSSVQGSQILASARYILKCLDKADAGEVSLADIGAVLEFVATLDVNGDGVVSAKQASDEVLRTAIVDIGKCAGTVADLSGDTGIDESICNRFFADATGYSEWFARSEAGPGILVLGEKTGKAAAAFHAVKDKVDDYFTRCSLAAYDARAALPLSRLPDDYQQLAAKALSAGSEDIAHFPLATIEADKPLPLRSAINPAWQTRIEELRDQVIVPIFGNKESITHAEWLSVCGKFAAYETWQAGKPATCVESLGITRIREILDNNAQVSINELIVKDRAVQSEVQMISTVEKLLRYKRDLLSLVKNFVSFRRFYSGKEKAIFQVGTLYLDGRSCDLCVSVTDVGKHASMASQSGVCIAYCDCVRLGGKEKMSIAAAFTAGDSDFLMLGRNGVFYDRDGQDWDATIVRILDNPISIRQAFWSPYKKLIKTISDQVQKFAASKASSVESSMMKAAVENSKAAMEKPGAVPPKPAFDVGKFAGIFAAIGLAIGAIGGILASIVSGILGLKFWQIPLALVGLMLVISLPSMALAWFKLKRRNLGPILDANGWAINSRVMINIPFGTSLTKLARIPDGAVRALVDPYAESKPVWPYYVALIALITVLWWVFGTAGGSGVQ